MANTRYSLAVWTLLVSVAQGCETKTFEGRLAHEIGGKTGILADKGDTSETVGSRAAIENACQVNYKMAKGDLIHLSLAGRVSGTSFHVSWVAQNAVPVVLMSWSSAGPPYFEPAGRGQSFDEQVMDMLLSDDMDYKTQEKQELGNFDFFHCTAACRGFQEAEHMDALLITLDTQFSGKSSTMFEGWYKFDFYVNKGKMISGQFDAIANIYTTLCVPHRNGTVATVLWASVWTKRTYANNHFADPDANPFCWWQMKGMDVAKLKGDLAKVGSLGTCAQIDNIHCDDAGNVLDLLVNGYGLRGDLPAASLGVFTAMRLLHLAQNRITATALPLHLLDHASLKEIDLSHNFIAGATLPCFSGDPITDLVLSFNMLSGVLPACLKDLTLLETLSLTGNSLTGTIPAGYGTMTKLLRLFLNKNLLTGGIPDSLCSTNSKLQKIDAAMNTLSGPLNSKCVQQPVQLKSFDVAYNQFTGNLPISGSALRKLKWIDLSHNNIGGTLTTQFDQMFTHLRASGTAGSDSELLLDHNKLSGPLPDALQSILTVPNKIGKISLYANYFRCDKVTGWYPTWYYRVADIRGAVSDLGEGVAGICLPVPEMKSISPKEGRPGVIINVAGDQFVRIGSPRCKFIGPGGSFEVPAANSGISDATGTAATLICYAPSKKEMVPGTYELTVANYGNDWASSSTVAFGKHIKQVFNLLDFPEKEDGAKVKGGFQLVDLAPDGFSELLFKTGMSVAMGMKSKNIYASLKAAGGRRLATSTDIEYTLFCDTPEDAQAKLKLVGNLGLIKTDLVLAGLTGISAITPIGEPSIKGVVTKDEYVNTTVIAMSPVAILLLVFGATAACCFCGFVFFLYRMEKAGKPFFMALDEEDDDEPVAKKKKGHFDKEEEPASSSAESPAKPAENTA